MVLVLSGADISPSISQIFRNLSCGVPQMRETISGV